ncbi:hypothetical protein [Yinghuangia sp. YIM S10712]|uniref:hypothetical protein n=1 Tax=Yinghuangia sp. YIM S10712 TaxID=3436930 RepID=UPI003F531A0D
MSAGTPKSPLAAASGLICFVLVVGGLSGLAHELFGWIRFMGFVRFLVPDGYEVVGYIVMVVLGVIIGAAGDAVGRRARD